jgi:regulator of RNase E activity RraA
VNPGDIIVADEDGVVVIPPRWIDEVATEAQRLADHYASVRPVLERGEVTHIATITERFLEQGLEIADR